VREKLVEDLVAAEDALMPRLQTLVAEGVEARLPFQGENELGAPARKRVVASARQPVQPVAPRRVARK
jgi:hypothetical protein